MKKALLISTGIIALVLLTACDEGNTGIIDDKDKDTSSLISKNKTRVDPDETKKELSILLDTKTKDTDGKTIQKTFDLSMLDQDVYNTSSSMYMQDVVGVIKDNKETVVRFSHTEEGALRGSDIGLNILVGNQNDQPKVTITQKDESYMVSVVRNPYTVYTQAPVEGTVTDKTENK